MAKRYKTIGLPEDEFQTLSEAKALYEADTNQKVDWGKFLLALGVGYMVGKGLAEESKPRRRQSRTS